MSDDKEHIGEFDINYDMVLACKECLPATRLLAADLMQNPYLTVGMFLKNLSDSDLATFSEIVETSFDLEDDDEVGDPRLADLVLIAEMLSRAEGITSEDDAALQQTVNKFMVMITMESLARKGLVRVYHNNMSFGEDAADRIVIEKIKDFDDDLEN